MERRAFVEWAVSFATAAPPPDVPDHVCCTFAWAREGATARGLLAPFFGTEDAVLLLPGVEDDDERVDAATDIVGDLLTLSTADNDTHFASKEVALQRRIQHWLSSGGPDGLDACFRPAVARAVRRGVSDWLGVDTPIDQFRLWHLLRKRVREIMGIDEAVAGAGHPPPPPEDDDIAPTLVPLHCRTMFA